jgi:chromosome segregation ATPase
VDWRVEQSGRVAEHHDQLNGHQQAVDWHEACIVDHRRRLDEIESRFGELERLQRWTANELERVIPQVAAQESELESLRGKLDSVPIGSEPEVEAARSLIDEIRREHAQIRVRLTGIAQYEDRLRKLEERTVAE